ncbi:GntR family transcriptional regulator [Paenibacillus sp. GCM10012307]|uniref:GntR family transcriptional regulator n=1 Tax=Paenibacillus roseus TaxID=2798579 RepID=A0A934J210_9BACL|nr:GntR family transcriptional regulator [Paenibacillus roseus]MBJ6361844.1 GntR family transcriptional regulator [Paenibacillus roseus]
MVFVKPPQSASTREVVYSALREQILQLELPPGTGLSEKEISLQFNVSRTPVRESFVQLAQEGLLEILPQRGTYVSLIDNSLVEEARFMREQLERAVIQLACESFPEEQFIKIKSNLALQKLSVAKQDDKKMFELDEEFHRAIFEGCGKSYTWGVIQHVNVHLNRSRMLRLAADHNWSHIYSQHEQIVAAIEAHDSAEADRLMKNHLNLTVTDQSLLKEKFPTYFKTPSSN